MPHFIIQRQNYGDWYLLQRMETNQEYVYYNILVIKAMQDFQPALRDIKDSIIWQGTVMP